MRQSVRRCKAGRGVGVFVLALVCTGGFLRQVAAVEVDPATARAVTRLAEVHVNASRLDLTPFNVPAALSVVQVRPADAGQPGVNFSEALVGIPGILARDRQNYAQDEQISIRGFGSRATFGVRSIRIFMDGIPSTLPDGQGQVSQFNLDSAARVEVLRGPFSVLYGNAAGGVIQLWSADGTAVPQTTIGIYGGSNDSFKYGATTRGIIGLVDYNISASQFLSGGYRQHSRVRRQSVNAKFGIDLGDRRKLTLVLNRLDQPEAQDPLGLTRAQVDADPHQATAVASQYDTRKSTEQNQLGVIYEQALGHDDQLRLMGYYGYRSILQYLSIPPGAQKNPLQSGGVIAPNTDYGGADARWTHHGELAGRTVEFVLGASADYQIQHRTGYENFIGDTLGVEGRLRRNENDNVVNVAQYAQWYWRFAQRWSLLLGLRHDEVRFAEHDFYVTARNPDDSGHVQYSATTPVIGLQFRPGDNLRLYVSYGRGFETPSYSELGYRSDGQAGLAFNLLPARSRNWEAGLKWRLNDALEFDAAAFRSDTRSELAVATNQNGRSTYQNVGDTRRQGMELSLTGDLGHAWRLNAGFTHLQARFRSGFLTCTGRPCPIASTPVAPGSRMPGVPDNYGSLRLEHGHALGWRGGLTLTGVGSVTVNDIDSQRAAGYGLVGLDVSYGFALGGRSQLQLSARVDNLANRRYIGSVIVNDGNGRYFEPGPDRSYMLGARLTF
ncbi:MAG: TonB-dependent receptor [Rhodanobacter sp.]|nr:MAG: TonB-dependent receptor [Rhodanobacter sp.]TAL92118.1 MAG: TonB-dependent receptor [Rhodanobacter sp.]TAM38802.1 MAG: TonB-dependent receptor [Rhodanobacter sp.]